VPGSSLAGCQSVPQRPRPRFRASDEHATGRSANAPAVELAISNSCAFIRALVQKCEAVAQKLDFTELVRLLLGNDRGRPDGWENGSLDQFLDSLVGFVKILAGRPSSLGSCAHGDRPRHDVSKIAT
jgi:hypothetical protein